MKTKLLITTIALILVAALSLIGCSPTNLPSDSSKQDAAGGTAADLGNDDTTFGTPLEDTAAYDGYFSDEQNTLTVECLEGTADCYTLENNILTFSGISEDSAYSVSGKLSGNIVIDAGDDYKFDLELHGLSLVSDDAAPIVILSGNEVSVKATKNYENYIYDTREAVSDEDAEAISAAIYSVVDLEIAGKGSLTVVSANNNGIHTKDDLEVKNLTLLVACVDNALKGNYSVQIEDGTLTLIATGGDGIKTSNSDVSSKGNQRGDITIIGGTHTIYAACDGIDASHDVIIEDSSTVLNVFTDKYSNYSSAVTAVDEELNYIRFTSNAYSYSVLYYNSDEDFKWVNATYCKTVTGNGGNYYYYSFPTEENYSKIQYFVYSDGMTLSQSDNYLVATELLVPSAYYDTFALNDRGTGLTYSFTNYSTAAQSSGGMGGFGGFGGMGGGMQEGNTDKGEYSTKGLKADNAITVTDGTVNVKSYDDALHANSDVALENGETSLGNITINGGTLTLYSNDDGVHADGSLTINGGSVTVSHSYEGLEGNTVTVTDGTVSVFATDDGINSTATAATGVSISGGTLYVYCNGDGIDSNTRLSYNGIAFSGGKTVIISTSSGNSAIDTEQGYSYTGGTVIALMPRGGMSSEATKCQSFTSCGSARNLSFSKDSYLTAEAADVKVTVKLPCSMSAYLIVLGDSSPTATVVSETEATLDSNGVCWE